MYEITAPVKDYASEVGGVQFTEGIAHTDDPNLVGYFRRHGYDVEQLEQVPDEEPDDPEAAPEPEPTAIRPPVNAPKGDWVTYSVDVLGMSQEDAEAATKQDLIDLANQQ